MVESWLGLFGEPTQSGITLFLCGCFATDDSLEFEHLKLVLQQQGIPLNNRADVINLIHLLSDTCEELSNGFHYVDIAAWFNGAYGFGVDDIEQLFVERSAKMLRNK